MGGLACAGQILAPLRVSLPVHQKDRLFTYTAEVIDASRHAISLPFIRGGNKDCRTTFPRLPRIMNYRLEHS